MSDKQHQLARSAGIFTGATLLSRILGYARDSTVAYFFGAGATADAFYIAFRFSNFFRRLLGEGAMAVSFIPVFSEYREKHGSEETQRLLSVMFTTLFVVLAVLTLLGIAAAPALTRLIATGLERTPERFALTVTLTRYMFPFLLFICLAALMTGVLNSFRSFFLPALAPACLSIAEIAYLLLMAFHLPIDRQALGLALAVSVGGLLQFGIQVPGLYRRGYRLSFAWDLGHRGLRRIGALMLPAMVGVSADQINALVDTRFASYLEIGAQAALYNSNRVMQLPLALFGVALSQVSLPVMSAYVARGATRDVKETLNFSLRLTLFMILPATVGLAVLGEPIVKVLFEHGRFTPQATALTTWALLFFSLGLAAYASVKILASAFYAYQDTRVPVSVAAGCVAVNIAMNWILLKHTHMGVGGLALSTSTASWINAGILFWLLRRRLGLLGGRRILVTLAKSLLACTGMALFCRTIIQTPFGGVPLLFQLAVAIGGGSLIYMGAARLLRMEEWAPFWAQISRRARRPSRAAL
jgi:putative peptidoglycan lipid II flippase